MMDPEHTCEDPHVVVVMGDTKFHFFPVAVRSFATASTWPEPTKLAIRGMLQAALADLDEDGPAMSEFTERVQAGDPTRDLIREALDDVEQDVLVTKAHAEQMADQIARAMAQRGWRIEEVMEMGAGAEPHPWGGAQFARTITPEEIEKAARALYAASQSGDDDPNAPWSWDWTQKHYPHYLVTWRHMAVAAFKALRFEVDR